MTDFASHRLWRDTRLIPVYVAGVSVVVTLLTAAAGALHKVTSDARDSARPHDATRKNIRAHVTSLGGTTIFAFRVARAVSVFALLALYAYDFARDVNAHIRSEPVTKNEILDLVVFLTYVCFSISLNGTHSHMSCSSTLRVWLS